MPRTKKKITPSNKKPEPGRKANGMGSIRQKTVKGQVYWEARYSLTDPLTGKTIQKSISGKDKTEVEKKLRKILVELEEGTYIPPSKQTLGEWLDIWLDTYAKPSLKPLTLLNYAKHINNHIKPALGDIRLDRLNPHTLQHFYNDLGTAHGDKPGLGPGTIHCSYTIFHKVLQQAVVNGYLSANPLNACVLPKAEKRNVTAFNDEQTRNFLKAIQGNRFEVLFYVTLFTGLRRGEICGLTWDCVDLDKGTLTINKQLQNIPGHPGEYHFMPPKNGKSRTIAAADSVIEALRRHRVQQMEARLKAGPAWQNEGQDKQFVFTDNVGHHVSPHSLFKNYKRIAASIGLPDTRFHDLRHPYVKQKTKIFRNFFMLEAPGPCS